MNNSITTSSLYRILWGSAFLGSGGGGSIKAGKYFISVIESYGNPIQLLTLPLTAEMEKEWACACCDIGANGALDPEQAKALIYAYELLLKHVAPNTGIKAIFPLETGPENMLAPFVLAAHFNLAVIDGDGAGRAVPTLPLCTFSADDRYKTLPIAMSSGTGDRLLVQSESNVTHEALLRDLVQLSRFQNSASLAMWPDQLKFMVDRCVPGSVSRAMDCGKLLEGFRNNDQSLVDESIPLVNKLRGYLIGRGHLQTVTESTSGGFSFARIILENTKSNTLYTVVAQNESLVAYSSDSQAPVAYAPTSICYLRTDFYPYTNAEMTDQSVLEKHPEVFLIAVLPQEQLSLPKLKDGFSQIIHDLVVVPPEAQLAPSDRNIMYLGDLLTKLWEEVVPAAQGIPAV